MKIVLVVLLLISSCAFAQKVSDQDTVKVEIDLTDFQANQLKSIQEQIKPLRDKEELLVSLILDASGKVSQGTTIIGFFYDEKNKKFLLSTTKPKKK